MVRRESGPVASGGRRDPWQDFSDGDLADLETVDHDRYGLALFEDAARRITVRVRTGVDLDLAVDQVDDPVDGDAAFA